MGPSSSFILYTLQHDVYEKVSDPRALRHLGDPLAPLVRLRETYRATHDAGMTTILVSNAWQGPQQKKLPRCLTHEL